MRQLAGTKVRYRRAHAAPLAGLISGRVEYINLTSIGTAKFRMRRNLTTVRPGLQSERLIIYDAPNVADRLAISSGSELQMSQDVSMKSISPWVSAPSLVCHVLIGVCLAAAFGNFSAVLRADEQAVSPDSATVPDSATAPDSATVVDEIGRAHV